MKTVFSFTRHLLAALGTSCLLVVSNAYACPYPTGATLDRDVIPADDSVKVLLDMAEGDTAFHVTGYSATVEVFKQSGTTFTATRQLPPEQIVTTSLVLHCPPLRPAQVAAIR